MKTWSPAIDGPEAVWPGSGNTCSSAPVRGVERVELGRRVQAEVARADEHDAASRADRAPGGSDVHGGHPRVLSGRRIEGLRVDDRARRAVEERVQRREEPAAGEGGRAVEEAEPGELVLRLGDVADDRGPALGARQGVAGVELAVLARAEERRRGAVLEDRPVQEAVVVEPALAEGLAGEVGQGPLDLPVGGAHAEDAVRVADPRSGVAAHGGDVERLPGRVARRRRGHAASEHVPARAVGAALHVVDAREAAVARALPDAARAAAVGVGGAADRRVVLAHAVRRRAHRPERLPGVEVEGDDAALRARRVAVRGDRHEHAAADDGRRAPDVVLRQELEVALPERGSGRGVEAVHLDVRVADHEAPVRGDGGAALDAAVRLRARVEGPEELALLAAQGVDDPVPRRRVDALAVHRRRRADVALDREVPEQAQARRVGGGEAGADRGAPVAVVEGLVGPVARQAGQGERVLVRGSGGVGLDADLHASGLRSGVATCERDVDGRPLGAGGAAAEGEGRRRRRSASPAFFSLRRVTGCGVQAARFGSALAMQTSTREPADAVGLAVEVAAGVAVEAALLGARPRVGVPGHREGGVRQDAAQLREAVGRRVPATGEAGAVAAAGRLAGAHGRRGDGQEREEEEQPREGRTQGSLRGAARAVVSGFWTQGARAGTAPRRPSPGRALPLRDGRG